MYQSHPSSYMSAADPHVFESQIVVVRDASTGNEYTPEDYRELLGRPGWGMPLYAISYYIGLVKFAHRYFPNVDIYAEKGSGLATVVGAELPDLTVGQPLGTSSVFTRDGDANQEDITNDAIQVWSEMPCFRFKLTDNVGVDHFALAQDRAVLSRLLAHLRLRKSECPTGP
jgi:lysophospholipase-3